MHKPLPPPPCFDEQFGAYLCRNNLQLVEGLSQLLCNVNNYTSYKISLVNSSEHKYSVILVRYYITR